MTFVAYRLVRPYPRYSSIVYYTCIVISLRPVITSLALSKAVAVRMQYTHWIVLSITMSTVGRWLTYAPLTCRKRLTRWATMDFFLNWWKDEYPMFLYVIEHWFSIGRTCVKRGTYFYRYFDLSCGVRQGGVLSPYLFAIYSILTVSLRKLRPHALAVM